MSSSQSFTKTNRPSEPIHRTEKPRSKGEICNRAGITMHDTAPSTVDGPTRIHR
jgi:hypothetical protein